MDKLSELLSTLGETGKARVAEITTLKADLQSAVSLKERLTSFDARTQEGISELAPALGELGLDVKDIVTFGVNFVPVDAKIEEFRDKIVALETDNGLTFTLGTDFTAVRTISDLRAAYEFVKGEIDRLKEQLSTPQRRYQTYVERLSAWNTKRADLVVELPLFDRTRWRG